jgi:hypothetical protein
MKRVAGDIPPCGLMRLAPAGPQRQGQLQRRLSDRARFQGSEHQPRYRPDSERHPGKALALLADNAGKTGVKTLQSVLQYKVIEKGSGAMPQATDSATVHYRGTLTAGTEFDSSYSRNQPATFALNRVIPGWTGGPAAGAGRRQMAALHSTIVCLWRTRRRRQDPAEQCIDPRGGTDLCHRKVRTGMRRVITSPHFSQFQPRCGF